MKKPVHNYSFGISTDNLSTHAFNTRLRSKHDFEINVRAGNEITKILWMLDDIHMHFSISTTKDEELEEMKEGLNGY